MKVLMEDPMMTYYNLLHSNLEDIKVDDFVLYKDGKREYICKVVQRFHVTEALIHGYVNEFSEIVDLKDLKKLSILEAQIIIANTRKRL